MPHTALSIEPPRLVPHTAHSIEPPRRCPASPGGRHQDQDKDQDQDQDQDQKPGRNHGSMRRWGRRAGRRLTAPGVRARRAASPGTAAAGTRPDRPATVGPAQRRNRPVRRTTGRRRRDAIRPVMGWLCQSGMRPPAGRLGPNRSRRKGGPPNGSLGPVRPRFRLGARRPQQEARPFRRGGSFRHSLPVQVTASAIRSACGHRSRVMGVEPTEGSRETAAVRGCSSRRVQGRHARPNVTLTGRNGRDQPGRQGVKRSQGRPRVAGRP